MANKYLDLQGLLYFKQKLDNLFATQAVVSTKIADPATKSAGQILSYNGTNWVASEAPEGGVISFNGRAGAVVPASGDYDASQIDFDDTTSGLDVDSVQDAIEAVKDIADAAGEDVEDFKAVSGIVKVTNGVPSAAVAGTDYQIPLTAGVDYQVPLTAGDNIDITNNVISATVPEIPTVTINATQVISLEPVKIQLTADQYDIFTDNLQVKVDVSALEMGEAIFNRAGTGGEDDIIIFVQPIREGNAEIDINTSMVASYTTNGFKLSQGENIIIEEVGEGYKISAVDTTYEFADNYDATTNKGATVKTVTDAIGSITTFSFHICTSSEYDPITRIPTIVSPSSSTIYLVPKATTTTSQAYVEWAYISNNWEVIGDTQISIETITNSEIDNIFN